MIKQLQQQLNNLNFRSTAPSAAQRGRSADEALHRRPDHAAGRDHPRGRCSWSWPRPSTCRSSRASAARPTPRSSPTRAASTRATWSRSAASGSAGSRTSRSTDSTVIVKFEVDHGVEFGKESEASIEVLNLLGEKYLELTPAGDGQLDRGRRRSRSSAPSRRTTSSASSATSPPPPRRSTRDQLVQALDVVVDDDEPGRARDRGRASTASPGSRETVASRDAEIQALLASSKDVTPAARDRSEDLVALMESGDLVFQEVTQAQGGGPPAAGQRPDPGRRAARASPQDNQAQIGPALRGGRRAARPAASARRRSSRPRSTRSAPTSPSSATSSAPARGSTPTPSTWPRSRPASSCRGSGTRSDERARARAIPSPGAWSLVAVAVLLLVGTFVFVMRDDAETKTVTAHFPRAVSVYEGTDVRILGVNVGKVTAVIPEGNSVRVEMEYDAKYDVPADAKAAIVTPTLVADRFVQLTPAYDEGDKVMADGADIPLPDTGVPVELDRIYASLRGPHRRARAQRRQQGRHPRPRCCAAGARRVRGQRRAGQPRCCRNLSEAAVTFGEGSGDLFDTVSSAGRVHRDAGRRTTRSSGPSCRTWPAVSAAAGRRARASSGGARRRSPTRSARSRRFVRDNRKALVTDVEKLTRVMQDDQLRAGQHRHRADGRAGRDRQPGPRLRHAVRHRSAPGSASAATSGTSTASCARSCSSPGLPAVEQGPRLHALRADRRVRSTPSRGRRPRRPCAQAKAAGSEPGAGRDPRRAAVQTPTRATTPRSSRPARGCVVTGARLAGRGGRRRAAALLLSGCEFDGAYDLPLPGSPVDEDNSLRGHRGVRRHPQRRAPLAGDGRRRHRRRGHRRRAGRLARRGHAADPRRRRAPRQRDRRHPPGQPARREVRRARGARAGRVGRGRLGDGDNIPLADTGRNPEVEEVLGALSFLLSGGGVAQLGTIIEELNHVMSGREERLRRAARLAGGASSARSTSRRPTSSARWSR